MKITKILLSFLSLVAIGCAACSASSSKRSVDSVDSTSFDESESDTETQCIGMLKAFGLKDKVKTITFFSNDEDIDNFSISFDYKGNVLDYPDYNGGVAAKESSSPFFSYEVTFDNWKWTKLYLAGRMRAETTYEMVKYDINNRPVLANVIIDDQLMKKNVSISYSGADAKGNYTQINFDTKGINYDGAFPFLIGVINVKIEYWPDYATISDIPTKLSENIASELIKKANIKDNSALSVDLKKVVDLENDDSTLINYGEVRHADNVVVKISDIKVGNTGDTASVEFFFAPIYSNGKYDESYFNDNEYLRLAEFVYENGGWKVDDIGWDVHIMYGINFAEESYKQYVRKYK